MDFDLVITNGIIVTASEVLPPGLDIGVKNGKISCIGTALPTSTNTKTIDAEGAYITPGGVDSHVHLAQKNSPTGDNWESGSRSAAAGGTTTIIAFASQPKTEETLWPTLEDYKAKSANQSFCDYGFHFILTNPTPDILENELPVLAEQEGITSVKLYMTYEAMKVNDREILEILFACKSLGMTTMIHAESHDMISMIIEGLERNKNTDPFFHAIARPRIAEDEASYRAISLAELADAPMLIVHMSSDVAVAHVREAQARLLPIHAETCPHYLFLLSEKIKSEPHDHFSGAKHVCSPPLRHDVKDLDGLWQNIANGTFTTFSSDHAPSKYDHPGGKQLGIVDGVAKFSKIPNGLPGVETRMALLFGQTPACQDASCARLSLPRFVQLTATNPAKLYGLDGVKGSIAPGYDADFVIWHPGKTGVTTISQSLLHHDIDYTPFEGIEVGNWPRYTILRGEVVWDQSRGVVGKMGYGQYLKRGKGQVLVGRTGNVPRGMKGDERQFWAA
ncbi:Putative metal-dependent hydrolase, composite domain superfamily, hydantoinase/dihydropyrimidinase [Septoria linicola]|uniref:dihydropyrimidinase n=1 Tax=Septoria linicola TaxID=215465 RepID=A0A9Q9EL36_9PEZI|nr:putative metal-dependent hydrolase, composite domain superfamily, hydantoinase/dihydropyrimidinase [Septoria linicola]USW53957.1 Putative metal-dependent hydrolase, composite domain superfamily, hydantoinase/dihydropyrimidinase [Septoria linicola]